ncbi:MAG TPA: ABC transporter substrate-binding protein [Candidatus Binatia bacterium]|nr:ABC transporter substrate-binding protein [Candidatus Binatia bacterium]
MRKKIICVVLTVASLALCVSADAQQQKVEKIGWLGTSPASSPASGAEVIRRELSKLGYVEGKNIAFEHRYYEGNLDRLPALAHELVRLKVGIIFTSSTPAARAAKKATSTIPIVFYAQGDPVVAGLVESLGRPGGNITGFTSISPVVAAKRLELLKETVPRLSRVAVLWTPGQSEQSWKQSQLAARQLGLHAHSMEISNADQFDNAFKEAIKTGSTALAVTPTPLANSNRKLIAELTAKNRLPAIYPDSRWANSGGLMSYGADRTERYRRIALIVDKIFKGAQPADLPVEQPTTFELVINLKTAKALGVKIPAHLLMAANKVIE